MMHDSRLFDLVDAEDNVIGTIASDDYARLVSEKLGYIRSAEVLFVNDQGKVWIPVRTSEAKIAPGGLDYSVGCHILAGETYEDAIVREASQDHHIAIDRSQLQLQRTIHFTDIPYIGHVYLYRTDEEPTFNTQHYTEAQWLTPAEVLAKIDSGMNAKSSLKDTVRLLV